MPLRPLLSTGRALTWVFTGDSITQGVAHTHGARSWVEHAHERIRFQLGRVMDVVVNTGIAGWTAPDVLGEFDHLVGRFDPDVVSVALGMNDSMAGPAGRAHFADALTQIARRSAALGSHVALHTPNAIAVGAWNAQHEVAEYAQVVRDVATDLDAILVDHHAHWEAHFDGRMPWDWLDEAVHPNAEGHRQMADVTLRALGLGSLAQ